MRDRQPGYDDVAAVFRSLIVIRFGIAVAGERRRERVGDLRGLEGRSRHGGGK
jgi:hypothetical protein